MKNIYSWFKYLFTTVIITTLFCSAAVFGADTEIVLQAGSPVMTVNGVEKEIDPGIGTKPAITNGRTLLPIRAIIEEMGGTASWNDAAKQIKLSCGDNTAILTLNSAKATVNGAAVTMDTAPTIINGRTMLPIRFVAESFGFDVTWNDADKTITVTTAEENISKAEIPPYSGSPYTAINNNKPYFTSENLTTASFETYSPLDSLGRCGTAFSCIGRDLMPTEERGSIGQVKPSGWHTVKYDNVDGKYLYNRCHLIGYQLTAENANEKNLITGTRYLNVEGMLPFENMTADYIKETNNHVLYRVTPVFSGNNLLADGVIMEGFSVEDNGAGICFNVFAYNVQPGISINYATGESSLQAQDEQRENGEASSAEGYVLNTNTKKFHYPYCSSVNSISSDNKQAYSGSRNDLIAQGYEPCKNCNP